MCFRQAHAGRSVYATPSVKAILQAFKAPLRILVWDKNLMAWKKKNSNLYSLSVAVWQYLSVWAFKWSQILVAFEAHQLFCLGLHMWLYWLFVLYVFSSTPSTPLGGCSLPMCGDITGIDFLLVLEKYRKKSKSVVVGLLERKFWPW